MRDHIFSEINVTPIKKKVEFIQRFLKEHSLKILLWAVKLSKSSYYEFINRKPSSQSVKSSMYKEHIMEIWLESDEVFGARKIKKGLKDRGIFLAERTISKYMRELGICSTYRKKYRPKSTKSSNDDLTNFLKSENVNAPLTHVVTDITYIHTRNDGWVYQLTFMDAFTRCVLLSDVSSKMDDEFVSGNALKLLKKHTSIKMLHSDRGSQYTSKRYKELLENNGVIASYSAKGYPYDNAIIESYHASIKRERLYREVIKDLEHAKQLVFAYNFGFYNTRRFHQSLGYLTPNQFYEENKLVAA